MRFGIFEYVSICADQLIVYYMYTNINVKFNVNIKIKMISLTVAKNEKC